MRILLLTKYDTLGASSRLRFLQYLPFFQDKGWVIDQRPLFSNVYLNALYSGKPRLLEVLKGYFYRMIVLLEVRKYDLILLEKELYPFLPAWIERFLSWRNIPYIVDYDDAQYHRYDLNPIPLVRYLMGNKIDVVMRHAALVITGNQYLADRAKAAGARRVEIIPTVVDTNRYQPGYASEVNKPIVGWIGTPQTSDYLSPLLPVFDRLERDLDVRFVAVGARPSDFKHLPIEIWPWTEKTEIDSIQRFDIGIMPLQDNPWERGKCGYKLIQCMACAIPVVASPVGVNKDLVEPDINGFLAKNEQEWYQHLRTLLLDPVKRKYMGQKGREKIEEQYSLAKQATRFVELIERFTPPSP